MTSVTNMPNTNNTKNLLFDFLLVANIVFSKDNEITWKHSNDQQFQFIIIKI